MIWVALTEAATLMVVVALFAQLLTSQQRAHARRHDLMLNQLLHAAGKTWTPPPAEQQPVQAEPVPPTGDFQWAPEQQPVY